MPWKIEYLEDLNIVHVVTYGEMYFDDWKRQAEEGVAVSNQHQSGRYLSDVRQMDDKTSIADILRMDKLYAGLAKKDSNRLALVIDRNQKNYRTIKIYEMACAIRGWNIRSFLERESAIRWLTAW